MNAVCACFSRCVCLVACCVILLLPIMPATVPLSRLYPFNTTLDNTTSYEDDGDSGWITLMKPFMFDGVPHPHLLVSNNGLLTFTKRGHDDNGLFTPIHFPYNKSTIIAPFWSDSDIEKQGGHVFFSQRTDPDTLAMATCDIRRLFRPRTCFHADWVFVVTWYNVRFYGANNIGKNRSNTFQMILVTGGNDSFTLFYYHQIQWTSSIISNADASTGTGGNPAQVPTNVKHLAGYNHADTNSYYVIEGSTTAQIINITHTSNVDSPGVWAFQLNGQNITAAETGDRAIQHKSSSCLGHELISVTGSFFTKHPSVAATYVELNVTFDCRVVSDTLVTCVTPAVSYTGRVTLVVRSMEDDDEDESDLLLRNVTRPWCTCPHWRVHSPFTIEGLSDKGVKLHRNRGVAWRDGANVTVSWAYHDLPASHLVLHLLAFKSGPGRPQWIHVDSFSVATTSGNFTFPLNVSASPCVTFILRLSSHPLTLYTRRSLWSRLFTVQRTPAWSRDWCATWQRRDRELPPLTRVACPTLLSQALIDSSQWVVDDRCGQRDGDVTCAYATAVSSCLHKPYPSANNGSDQICCYDDSGELADAAKLQGWGTVQRYHRHGQPGTSHIADLSNFEHDLAPYVHCGQLVNDVDEGRPSLAQLLDRRQRSDSRGYLPPKPAQGSGDPHLTSFDGLSFTFNGLGEFILVETEDGSGAIQVRAEQAHTLNGSLQSASVFTGVGVGGRNSDRIVVFHDRMTLSKLYHNGSLLQPSSDSHLKFTGIIAEPTWNGNALSNVKVTIEGSGLSVIVEAGEELLNVMVMCQHTLKGKLRGLLGNYNGDRNDDFRPRDLPPLPANSTNRDVHYTFGMSWNVSTSESLFHYAPRRGPHTYLISNFTPTFLDEMDPSGNRSAIKQLCGTSTECVFDYVTTGNRKIALATKRFIKKFEEINRAAQPVTLCDFPVSYPNTTHHYTSRRVGAKATYWCVGRVTSSLVMICLADGVWSHVTVSCRLVPTTTDVSTPDNTTQKRESTIAVIRTNTPVPAVHSPLNEAAIAGGGGAGVVVIAVVIVTMVVCRCRKRARGKRLSTAAERSRGRAEGAETAPAEMTEMVEYDMSVSSEHTGVAATVTHIPEIFSLYRNPAFLDILQQLTSDGTFKLPRPYVDDPQLYTEFF